MNSQELREKKKYGKLELLKDIIQKPEHQNKVYFIRQIQNGLFSKSGSLFRDPKESLLNRLSEFGYEDLYKNAISGKYDHDY